ncbi:hypothetical protein [Neptunomonas phycophila]|jgi:hypothetical protein|uniref:hypothetical protein n=1 Tax=Neptunomonas phycophila TaxID=1572645 RepID=UPI0035126A72
MQTYVDFMQTYGADDPASKTACRAQDSEKMRIFGTVAAFELPLSGLSWDIF